MHGYDVGRELSLAVPTAQHKARCGLVPSCGWSMTRVVSPPLDCTAFGASPLPPAAEIENNAQKYRRDGDGVMCDELTAYLST